MRYGYLLLFIAGTILFSCKREKGTIDPSSPLTGPNAGQKFQLSSFYTYYP